MIHDNQGLELKIRRALISNDVDLIENLSSKLSELSISHSEYGPWCKYFEGLLTKKRDFNSAQSEATFNNLLNTPNLEPYLRGQVLLSLGHSYYQNGLWPEAIDACEIALDIFTQFDEPLDQAKVWIQIAQVYSSGFQHGEYQTSVLQDALLNCESAIAVLKQIDTTFSDPSLLTIYYMAWLTIGYIAMEMNEWHSAIQHLEKCIEIAKQLNHRFYELFPYAHLADSYIGLGREELPNAFKVGDIALSIVREFYDPYQEFWISGILGYLHKTSSNYNQSINYYDNAFGLVDEVRSGISDTKSKTNFMATVTEEYANAVLTCIEADDPEKAFSYTEQARARIFLELLESPKDSLDKSSSINPADYQSLKDVLPPDFMILSYYTTGVIESSLARKERNNDYRRVRFPQEKILIFAITRDELQLFETDLSPNQIYPDDLDSPIEQYFLRGGIRNYLHAHLIKPVLHLIKSQKRIAICPHGPLHYVPFHALIDGNATPLLAEDGPEIVYASSATVLVRELVRRRGLSKQVQDEEAAFEMGLDLGCFAIGFNGVVNAETGKTLPGLDVLEHAEPEAEMIARVSVGKALVGAEIKKQRLYDEVPGYLYLHFSCHGSFNPADPMESTLYIGPEETLTANEVIEHLDLNCRLVTLSACETGLIQVKRGDELYGFARAFFQAGAKAVVATQWRVEERMTRIFAEHFINRLREGVDVATGLKESQLYLRNLTKADLERYLEQLAEESEHGWRNQSGNRTKRIKSSALPVDPKVAPPLERLLPGAADDEAVLADFPYYWAPYVLIGDPDLKNYG